MTSIMPHHATEEKPGEKFVITGEQELAMITAWFREGRGAKLWVSQNLSYPRPNQLSPGDVQNTPRWYHDNEATDLTPDQIRVHHRKYLELPPEWFPVCDKCNGSRTRAIAELAQIRGETVEHFMAEVELHPENWRWGEIRDGLFPCNYCHGKGHKVEQLQGKATDKSWWGVKIAAKVERQAADYCQRLKRHYAIKEAVSWDYDWIEQSQIQIKFYSVWAEWLSEYLKRTYEGLITDGVLREAVQPADGPALPAGSSDAAGDQPAVE